VCAVQIGISLGGTAAEYWRLADRSCWHCSTTDDALGHHTGTRVWRSSRLAWEDRVSATRVGQPLPFSSGRTRQYQSILVIRCSGLHCMWRFVVLCINLWTLECLKCSEGEVPDVP